MTTLDLRGELVRVERQRDDAIQERNALRENSRILTGIVTEQAEYIRGLKREIYVWALSCAGFAGVSWWLADRLWRA